MQDTDHYLSLLYSLVAYSRSRLWRFPYGYYGQTDYLVKEPGKMHWSQTRGLVLTGKHLPHSKSLFSISYRPVTDNLMEPIISASVLQVRPLLAKNQDLSSRRHTFLSKPHNHHWSLPIHPAGKINTSIKKRTKISTCFNHGVS